MSIQSTIIDEKFSLSFLNKFNQINIVEDCGVIKYQNPEWISDSQKPYKSCKCKIRYQGHLENGDLIDTQKDKFQEVFVKLFIDDHLDGIHYAISSMQVGEKSWFKLAPKYHYFQQNFYKNNDKLFENRINQETYLFYNIELISYDEPKKIMPMDTFQDVYNFYNQKKEDGNQFFQNKEYQIALQKYMKAIQQHKCVINKYQKFNKRIQQSMTEIQQQELNELLAKLHSNVAQCELNMKLYKDALYSCKQSNLYIKNNFKNTLRTAECFIFLKEYQFALEQFIIAQNIKQDDQFVLQRIQFCEEKLKIKLCKEKKMFTYALNQFQNDQEMEEKQKKKQLKIEKTKLKNEEKELLIQEQKIQENLDKQQQYNVNRLKQGIVLENDNVEEFIQIE